MKKLEIEHNGIEYSFEYMEQSDIVLVVKDEIPTYQIKLQWHNLEELFFCNCPGSVYHGKCWHIEVLPQLIAQPSIQEPWAEWAEDARRLYDQKHI